MTARRFAPALAVCAGLLALAGGIRLYLLADARMPEWKPDTAAWQRDEELLRTELGRAPRTWEPAQGPDVVVIVLDTTRLDRLGLYGYDRDTSPHFDA